jgi:hypothetical protein
LIPRYVDPQTRYTTQSAAQSSTRLRLTTGGTPGGGSA